MLAQGAHAACIRNHPEVVGIAAGSLANYLRRNSPVDTGMLRASIRVEMAGRRPTVSLGPEPYDRTALKAALEGRVVKRRRGRPQLARYYAWPANLRSYNPSYIDRSIDEVSPEVVKWCQQQEEADRQLELLNTALRRVS